MKSKRVPGLLWLALLTLPSIAPAADPVDSAAILQAHNRWRAEVGVSPLQYSTALAASAQAWADELRHKHQCRMQHSQPAGRYGENLYWAGATVWSNGKREVSAVPPNKPVDRWASEKQDYNVADNSCRPGKVCGHYTQLVWTTSTHVGCAKAVCAASGEQVWVCQYQPAGNIVGQRPY